MLTRRSVFLAGAGVPLLGASHAAAAGKGGQECVSLNGPWMFRLDADSGWKEVRVPHTWQVEPETAEYRGLAWYRRDFDAPPAWAEQAVRLEFEAVFHTATVWVNGKPAGSHVGKGYTAFTLDVGPLLRYGGANTVLVRVDNSFSDAMLPRGRSSDWAHDGGVYRPVQLLITPPVFIERLEIDAEPDLAAGTASVEAAAVIRNASAKEWSGSVGYSIAGEMTVSDAAAVRLAPGETKTVPLRKAVLQSPRLWHFDDPNLYTFCARLSDGHRLETTFGIRKIKIRGGAFYLNGEKVRLMGVERMAGGNPEYGMAEPVSWIERDHAGMRNLNCIYTRVHWPQDRATLDWCDRHGMLIQTEVPAWGGATFTGNAAEPPAELMNNGLEQLREMIARDRNHPCIFSWGLCNEVNGQNPAAFAFVKRMYEEAKKLDPKRPATYASHSLFKTPGKDVSGLMDYVMFNEYVGSWQSGTPEDLGRILDEIHRAFPGKPLVISEYGYCACTPERPEGDDARIRILLEQDRVFRERDYIAGLIFFCYNDYRTHVGDRGVGALRQRVHGVVDLYGARKPSYERLRTESSPIESFTAVGTAAELKVELKTHGAIPAYTLRGYKLRAVAYGFGDIPVERFEAPLPDLAPGQQASVSVKLAESRPVRIALDVLRPAGSSVRTLIWKP